VSVVRAVCAAVALVWVSGAVAFAAQPGRRSIDAGSEVAKGHYVNVRYGYSVNFPTGLLVAEPESDAGDGRAFHARRGSAKAAVWGAWKLDDLDQRPSTIAAEAEQECGGPAAYKVVKPTMAAVSCVTKKGDVLYRKTLLKGDQIVSLQMTYPAAERATWDPVLQRVAASLTILEPAR